MLWPVAGLQVAQLVTGCNELSVAELTGRVEVRWREVKHGSARLSYTTLIPEKSKGPQYQMWHLLAQQNGT